MIEKWELCRDERGTSVRPADMGVNEDIAIATMHGPDRLKNGRKVAALPDMHAALCIAESFMSGFEGDELQDGIGDKLAIIRAAIAKAEGRADG